MSLDLTGLAELTGAALTTLHDDPERPGFQLDWPNGDFCRCHVDLGTPEILHFDYLHSFNGQHRLTQLVSTLPAYFRERGITAFVTGYGGATGAMLHVGFEDDQRGMLRHPIHEGCRMDQYAAWKRGGEKPAWRR